MSPDRQKYKNDYLSQVIARIDLTPPVSILDTGPSSEVVATLKKEFPIVEQEIVKQTRITIRNTEGKLTQEENTASWQYHGRNRDKRIVFTDETIFIEYTSYDCYEQLLEDFLPPVRAFADSQPGVQIRRLGFRYLDKLSFDGISQSGWEKYLDPRMLATLQLLDDGEMARALSVLEFNYGDWGMRFQFGFPNEDFPAPIRNWKYILDTDAYCNLLLDFADMKEWLDKFHEKAVGVFEKIITPKLRDLMEIRDAE